MTDAAIAVPATPTKLHVFSWVVLLGAFIQLTFSPGPVIFGAWGMLAPSMTAKLHMSRGGFMLALTAFNIGAIVAAPFIGRLIDKVGVRYVLLGSVLCLIGGFAVMAFGIHAPWQLFLVSFIWGVLTLGAQSISYTKLLTGWFKYNRGMALGIAASGLGLGYALVPIIAAWALAKFGWQGTLMALAVVVALGPLLISVPLARAPLVDTTIPKDHPELIPGLSLADTLRTRAFWYLAGAVLLISIALTGMTPHIYLLAKEMKLGPAQATAAASFYGIATILGRLIAGTLFDRFSAPRVCMFLFGCAVLGFGFLALLDHGAANQIMVFTAIVLLGLGFGAETDVIGYLTARYFGRRAFAQIYGCLLSAFVLGAAAGPPLIGYGHDHFGTYASSLVVAALLCVSAIFLVVRLPDGVVDFPL